MPNGVSSLLSDVCCLWWFGRCKKLLHRDDKYLYTEPKMSIYYVEYKLNLFYFC